ncbi:MAG: hypothetical protein BWY60_00222 [Actinobacteria bacterium ADurb.Bin346]|nr:MAG: hypothetical protein BWY60_00222 [Actinobacteria bacterium ADurb.Bin346]
MKYEYKPSFDKTFKKMESIRKEKALIAVSQLIDFFEMGVKSKGLGLKHLREIY